MVTFWWVTLSFDCICFVCLSFWLVFIVCYWCSGTESFLSTRQLFVTLSRVKVFSLTKRGHGFRVFRCCKTILDSQRLSWIMCGCSLCLLSCCSGWCVSSGLVDVERCLKATHLRPETVDGLNSSSRRSARHRRSPSTSLNPAIVPSLCLFPRPLNYHSTPNPFCPPQRSSSQCLCLIYFTLMFPFFFVSLSHQPFFFLMGLHWAWVSRHKIQILRALGDSRGQREWDLHSGHMPSNLGNQESETRSGFTLFPPWLSDGHTRLAPHKGPFFLAWSHSPTVTALHFSTSMSLGLRLT